jgi:hypothetical protein
MNNYNQKISIFQRLKYEDRISNLSHYGNIYALSIILVSQFIFLNFHYILGATLTLIAIISLLYQMISSSVEYYYLHHFNIKKCELILKIHFYVNHVFILLYIPFLIWAVVLMYIKASI